MNTLSNSRQDAVTQAVANELLEGLKVSDESQTIAQSYVVGKVSAADAAKKIRARYGAL